MASSERILFIVTAAGRSQRFIDAGYRLPKHELEIDLSGNVQCMIRHVLDTLPPGDVVIGESNFDDVKRDHGARSVTVNNSKGPADTVVQVLRAVNPDYNRPVVTLDCDTLLLRHDIERLVECLDTHAAGVLVYEDEDRNMSRIDYYPRPTVFVEKSPISEWGVVSARGFHDAHKLRIAAEQVIYEMRDAGREPSLSHVLNRYPGPKRAIEIAEWTDWGTPARIIKSGARITNG